LPAVVAGKTQQIGKYTNVMRCILLKVHLTNPCERPKSVF